LLQCTFTLRAALLKTSSAEDEDNYVTATVIQLSGLIRESQIQDALNKLVDGGTLVLPKNAEVVVRDGLFIDVSSRSLTIDLNGSVLRQAGDATVIDARGDHLRGERALLSTDNRHALTVEFKSASELKPGDWIKLYSDNELPNDQGAATRLGQAMQVVTVKGDTATLAGDLLDRQLYQNNVRASPYESGRLVLKNGTIEGDQSHPLWQSSLVQLRSTVDATVDHVTVRDGNSMGINIVDSVNAKVFQSAAINLKDDPDNGHYGYGVHSASSLNTTVNGFYAERVRHATDDNAVGFALTAVDPSKYGADIGMKVQNAIAWSTTAFAFSWHTEGRLGVISDSMAFDSVGLLGARGLYNSMSNVSGVGNERGIVFFEYGDGDGRFIDIANVLVKENELYAFFNQGDARDNRIKDSVFQAVRGPVSLGATTSFVNTEVQIGAASVDEAISGTAASDRLLGGKGLDVIDGGNGDDYIWGGLGLDRLTGGAGTDRFAYHRLDEAGDRIMDFSKSDVIDLSVLARTLGWSGDPLTDGHVRFQQAGAGTQVQVDADGDGVGFVTLATLDGVKASSLSTGNLSLNLVVLGSATSGTSSPYTPGPETEGAAGGTEFDDVLRGGEANDTLSGGGGDDRLVGEGGDDILLGGLGADTLVGGTGKDTASYDNAARGLTASLETPLVNTGEAAGDRYSQVENLQGSAYDDVIIGNKGTNALFGGSGADSLQGGDGSDTLYGGLGADLLDGGAGADKLYGEAGQDRLYGGGGSDVLNGGDERDLLYGGDGEDALYGAAGDDTLSGGDGRDWLSGGAGADWMTGGAGSDTFHFADIGRVVDVIMDFQHGVDHLALDASAFGISDLSKLSFVSDAGGLAGGPAVIYDRESGVVSFDRDGRGGESAVAFLALHGGTSLSISDFLII
jgi:Ca2+-binding RTX toxin-like protein